MEKQENFNRLENYFWKGCKDVRQNSIGIEIEHFVVHPETKETISYYGGKGIGQVLLALAKAYPDCRLIRGKSGDGGKDGVGAESRGDGGGENCLGFATEEFVITLEPAAQVEISIQPQAKISTLKRIYEGFCRAFGKTLDSFGYTYVTEGYQPVSLVENLEIIPKERYRIMNRHFQSTGTMGRNMMRGTGSVQVAVDYHSEEDFRKKIQAAYVMMPVFKLLMDNTPHFEGRDNRQMLKRTEIWNNVDPDRSGIIPDVLKEDYGFRDYALYLWNATPIFLPLDGKDEAVGMTKNRELFASRALDEPMIEHIISMFFPDVRLKQYIEIRGADSAEPARTFAYAALLKGLLYDEAFTEGIQRFICERHLQIADIKAAEASLMDKGWQGEIYSMPASAIVRDALEYGRRSLCMEEKSDLDPFFGILQEQEAKAAQSAREETAQEGKNA